MGVFEKIRDQFVKVEIERLQDKEEVKDRLEVFRKVGEQSREEVAEIRKRVEWIEAKAEGLRRVDGEIKEAAARMKEEIGQSLQKEVQEMVRKMNEIEVKLGE